MMEELRELEQLLSEGQRRSMQGSYQRRQAAGPALPYLREARGKLIAYTRGHPDDAAGWRLRSMAEEALLEYVAAIRSLERALALSPERDRRDLKRLVAIKEIGAKWEKLMLAPDAMSELQQVLEARLAAEPCDHSLRFTEAWIAEKKIRSGEKVVKAIRSAGGYCDCEVLANVV